jgi:hypothetical protein
MPPATLELSYLSANVALGAAPARFLKEIIRAGSYRHPARPGEDVAVTPERLRRWVKNFYAAPVKVWVPYRHSADPQDNTGWVEDVFLDDDRLFAVLRVTDENAARLLRDGTIEDVSVGVEAGFTDMHGRRYDELLRHVALTLDPHLRGQEGFVALDAAPPVRTKGGTPVPVSIYAYVDEATGEGYYPHHDEEGEVDLAAVRAALAELAQAGLDEELAARIREHLLAHLREAGEAQAATADVNAEAAAGAPALELEARVAELDRKNRRLRRTLRALAADRARERADALADEVAAWTAEGKVLPAYAPQVHALLAAGDALPLELEGRRTDVATVVREVLAALPPVVQFGERLSLAPPEDRVPLSPAEKAMLASLGVTTSDYRRYGGR